MRFFHLSDLHIGKQLHHYNLKEDQKIILNEVLEYAADLRPDAIIVAGDIYDKSVPSAESVTLFDDFLTGLSKIEPKIPLLMVSGNHDSADRLKYASGFLKMHQIHLAANAPHAKEECMEKVTLQDEYGSVNFYLLPFLKPSYVKNVFDETPESYSEAVKTLVRREKICQEERNILVSHQFYTGAEAPETCDSEMISVGGIDNIDVSVVEEFDYVALGHLHGKQKVKHEHIRYCGTLLKYSVSEATHQKVLTLVTIGEKGKPAEIQELPLHPVRDVKKIKGNLADILTDQKQGKCEDYVSITLTDDVEPYRPKEQLEKVFSNILEVRMDNQRTRKMLEEFQEELTLKSPFDAFLDFYAEMQGQSMGEEEQKFMTAIFENAGEEQ